MREIVHLWQQPVPASLAQAEALLDDLRQQLRFGDDGSVRALLEAIDAALAHQGRAADLFAARPEADTSDVVLTFRPAPAGRDQVLPAIEAAARQLGWVVFDPQRRELRLPTGAVFHRQAERTDPPLPARTPDLDTSPAARKAWLHRALAPVFLRRGWRSRPGEICFVKTWPWGNGQVVLATERQVTLRHGVWLRLRLPARLQAALNSDGGPALKLSLALLAQQQGLRFSHDGQPDVIIGGEVGVPTYGLPCASADDAARRGEELLALYDGVVLDWLDALPDLQALEHLANRVSDAACPFLGLRQRGRHHRLLNHHPDLLLAAAVGASDFVLRARDRLAQYQADGFGRTLVPQLRQLLAVCGLAL